ncbi:MAG: alpha/beta hydrolase [Gammaproteobacteria bacterium]
MAVHAQVQRVLDLIEKSGNPEFHELSPQEARAQFEAKAPILDAKPIEVHRVEEQNVDSLGGPIPVRIYTPCENEAPLPVIVWMHGGGHVLGSVVSYDAICRHLAIGSQAIVVSVDYRLAPEHKFPAAIDDAFAVVQRVASNADAFGGDPTRIAVAGDSAGGNLAAVSALMARDAGIQLRAQALVYPVTAPDAESDSHHDNAEGFMLTRANVLWFQSHYRRDERDRTDFRYAPAIAESHADLAPALIQVAEFDPLKDEGIEYANRLSRAGNQVSLTHYAGMIHGFFSLSSAVDAGRDAIAEVCAFLSKHLQ